MKENEGCVRIEVSRHQLSLCYETSKGRRKRKQKIIQEV